MPKVSQALRDSISDKQWNELFQDEKKLSEMFDYLNGRRLNSLEQRMFAVSLNFYLSLLDCFSNPPDNSAKPWKKIQLHPENGRKQGFFSANYYF
jgi:hypothetical protein